MLPRFSVKLLGDQFDEDMVKELMQDGCSSWTEFVDRRSPLTIYVLEDQQTEVTLPPACIRRTVVFKSIWPVGLVQEGPLCC